MKKGGRNYINRSPKLLSESLNREELIRQRVCIACRSGTTAPPSNQCNVCLAELGAADSAAFRGFFEEINRTLG